MEVSSIPQNPPTNQNELVNTQDHLQTNNSLAYVLIFIVIILLSSTIYLGYQNYQQNQRILTLENSITSDSKLSTTSPAPTEDIDKILHYKSAKHKIEFDYPESWTISDTSDGIPSLTMIKGKYSITAQFPEGFGPGVCIFSEHPDYTKEIEGPFQKCAGDYISINTVNGEMRRLMTNSEDKKTNNWTLYSKDKSNGYFVTVPLLNYETPKDYDGHMLEEMDTIISTYKASP